MENQSNNYSSSTNSDEERLEHLEDIHEYIGSHIVGVSALGVILLVILLLKLVY